jgi:nitroimidazol reductase NimA-like FMN-containing flavoprotein (pyridoxamine 5'-phosphate oxidase superfamily)
MPDGNGFKTPRTTLKRKPDRGAHDFDTIARILDEGLFCHVGFIAEGQPFVVPTAYGRDGHSLYIHGSAASRTLRELSAGTPVCLTVTLFDGLVLARSAFHNSINYRSVMVLGVARPVGDDRKEHGLRAITEHLVRGRWQDSRPPTGQELKATTVLCLEIEEASAKVRTGGPVEEPEDLALPVWAGVLPFALVPQAPVADKDLVEGVEVPHYVMSYRRTEEVAR